MVLCNLSSYHMTIDLKTIKHISKLSRISVDDEKAKKLEADLNSIFLFIEKLNELETKNVEPLTSIAETDDIFITAVSVSSKSSYLTSRLHLFI